MLNSAFPRAVLPLSQVYKGLVAFVPTVVVYVGIYAIWGADLQIGLLALPGLFAIQLTMNVGIALLMSTMVVFFRDTENALRYIQRFLFFTTPVIWPYTLLSDELQALLEYHPLYPLFTSYQMVLGGGTADAELVVRAAVWALILLVGGGWAFLRNATTSGGAVVPGARGGRSASAGERDCRRSRRAVVDAARRERRQLSSATGGVDRHRRSGRAGETARVGHRGRPRRVPSGRER